MFNAAVYKQRRSILKKQIGTGLVLLMGNDESPMNYAANCYPFRQDGSFLYYFGMDRPSLAAVIDIDLDTDTIFGDDFDLEDIIWMGEFPLIGDMAQKAGIKHTAQFAGLGDAVCQAKNQGRKIHFLPPYRAETAAKLSNLLEVALHEVKKDASEELIRAVVAQRSVKDAYEVREIESALAVSRAMYLAAMKVAGPGMHEREVVAAMNKVAISKGCMSAFPIICTIDGQTLHNHYHGNKIKKGDLLLIDSGVSSPVGYASDITRTIPAGGKFTAKQREIYEIVLRGQLAGIDAIRPGIKYKDVHLIAAMEIAAGLKALGLMNGNVSDAVNAGAHALFFPHGLGHMMGLDVHDMENLGENFAGYDKTVARSDQFGLAYLRMARELQPGFVVTVEPGIYFIPALIAKWKREKKFAQFINYAKVESYLNFGGVRIEDDVLVTRTGHRVLGKPIPKTVKEIEKTMEKTS